VLPTASATGKDTRGTPCRSIYFYSKGLVSLVVTSAWRFERCCKRRGQGARKRHGPSAVNRIAGFRGTLFLQERKPPYFPLFKYFCTLSYPYHGPCLQRDTVWLPLPRHQCVDYALSVGIGHKDIDLQMGLLSWRTSPVSFFYVADSLIRRAYSCVTQMKEGLTISSEECKHAE